jgi:hypothetical protein
MSLAEGLLALDIGSEGNDGERWAMPYRCIRQAGGVVLRTAVLAAAASFMGCASEQAPTERDPAARKATAIASPNTSTFPAHYARQWMAALANCVRGDTISPPVAARTYAYGAVTLYESVVHGMPGHLSLSGQLNGLNGLPEPDPGLEYDWPTVMAQAMTVASPQFYVFPERLFFEFTTGCQATLGSLGVAQIGYRRAAGVQPAVIDASISYGSALGGAIAAWANADGYPQIRYKGYITPEGPDKWVPTGFSDTDKVANPVEPYFGTLRPMVLTNPSECAPPAPVPFSTTPGSDMYNQADAVYQSDLSLTKEQREIAQFWADGPGATPTPPGHWLAIASSFIRTGNLENAVKGYAKTSISYFDSFIAVWQSKYEHNLLRPETYIRRHINPSWRPFLPTPPFPEYVSGHSGMSGAAAVTFTDAFGNGPFTDATKLRRGFGARSFTSFTHAAQEASISRLYGGIHFPMGNAEGLATGTCVGNAIVNRVHLMLTAPEYTPPRRTRVAPRRDRIGHILSPASLYLPQPGRYASLHEPRALDPPGAAPAPQRRPRHRHPALPRAPGPAARLRGHHPLHPGWPRPPVLRLQRGRTRPPCLLRRGRPPPPRRLRGHHAPHPRRLSPLLNDVPAAGPVSRGGSRSAGVALRGGQGPVGSRVGNGEG